MNELLAIIFIAKRILPTFLIHHELELGGNKGVFMFLKQTGKRSMNKMTGDIIGYLPTEKIAEEMHFAYEILTRLESGEWLTTFPTQNYDAGKFGAGVRSHKYLIAVSGFLPNLNHAFAVEVLKKAGQLTPIEETNIENEFQEYQYTGIS